MIRLKMRNSNMIPIEKLQNYQAYHKAKLVSINILLVKKYCLLIEKQKKANINQKQFELNLSALTTVNPKSKSKDQLDTIRYIKHFYESREEVIKLYKDYAKIKSEAVQKAKHGTRLKMLTSKQLLQTLPTVLAQVQAGNNSASSLNEMRQIFYYFYHSKQITKKYTIP